MRPKRLIKVSAAKKVSALRTENFFQTRAGRANLDEAKKILKRAGHDNPPVPGDEL
jgi:hypothetical protein